MREFLIAGTVVVAIAVSGCGGDDGQKQASAPSTTAQTTTTQSTATTDSTTPATPSAKKSAGKGKSGATTTPGSSGSSGSGGGTSGTFPPASSAEAQAVTAAVTGFYSALADGDGDKACTLLASRVTRDLDKSLNSSPELKGKDCGDVLDIAAKNYPEQLRQRLRKLHIERVSAKGDKAIAAYAGEGVRASQITVVREGGDWKVAAFKGAPPSLTG